LHFLLQGVENMKKFVMPRFIGSHHEKRRRLAAAALTVSLLLSGCGMLPRTLAGPAPDLALFQQGLDSLHGTTAPDAFSRLATEFPNSPWTTRAKAIEKALGRAKEEQRGHNQLQKKLEECQVEKERLASDLRSLEGCRKKLDECRVEKERLATDLRSLEKYTVKLKSLLTEAGIAEPVPPSR
jgi:hypothetical protein